MRQMLNKVTMKKEQGASTLFEQLSAIQNHYNTATRQINEEDLIAVVLDAAPDEYKSILTSEQRLKGNRLKLGDLEEVMNQHWQQTVNGHQGSANGSGKEVALSAFAGTCFNCNKKGHKASDCRAKGGAGKGGKFSGKCNNCGKVGH